MKSCTLYLIEIPGDIWTTEPRDRPFTALATDATASERRIAKGIEPGKERARYTQLCNWIESSALELLLRESPPNHLRASTPELAPYLVLLEILQEHSPSPPSYRLGRSFYTPEDVAAQLEFYEGLTEAALLELAPHLAQGVAPYLDAANTKAAFCREALGRNSAIVASLCDNPL